MDWKSILEGLVRAPLDSPLILVLSVLYILVQAIRIYDVRLIQVKQKGFFSGVAARAEGRTLPPWVGIFHWVGWVIFIGLFLLNWKYAVVFFALKVLPILENLGELVMRRFLQQKEG
jgi:hypothetical protein